MSSTSIRALVTKKTWWTPAATRLAMATSLHMPLCRELRWWRRRAWWWWIPSWRWPRQTTMPGSICLTRLGVYLSNSPYLNLSQGGKAEPKRQKTKRLESCLNAQFTTPTRSSQFDMKLTSHSTPLPPTTKIGNTFVNTTLGQLYLGPVKPFTYIRNLFL